MYFSNNIKYLRKNKNLGQIQFAEHFNVKPSTISGWETGKSKPSFDVLIELSKFFQVNLDDLVFKDMEKSTDNLGKLEDLGRMSRNDLKELMRELILEFRRSGEL